MNTFPSRTAFIKLIVLSRDFRIALKTSFADSLKKVFKFSEILECTFLRLKIFKKIMATIQVNVQAVLKTCIHIAEHNRFRQALNCIVR